ncbi:HAUS augmin-like complex subunit 6 [Portunus trituberculatus]|uniref:HAUS augmin-like complex subunit 6 n=1 Tax=Portunus trituberculatus TaxID=210409 RepID=A0A5B7FTX9_PORTR|nr:HAUS augmin-like complex subunit 6 [Portunus trituberculatus]
MLKLVTMSKQHIRLVGLQDPDHLLYVSLLILGLDPVALEHKLKTPVNQKCFSRINRKLGDAILHFLYVCLDREKAGKTFRDCWPVLDKKRESQFYKAAFEWYKTLQQSYKQPVPTIMTKTFMEPGGSRFTSTLMILARIALHTSVNKRGLRMRTSISIPVLPVIQYQNGTVAAARREMTELCI